MTKNPPIVTAICISLNQRLYKELRNHSSINNSKQITKSLTKTEKTLRKKTPQKKDIL